MSDQVLKAFEEAFGVWTTNGSFKHKPTQHQLDGFRKGYAIAEQSSADRIAQLEAELAEANDYIDKINTIYQNEEIFVVKNGEGFYTDKFDSVIMTNIVAIQEQRK